MIFSWFDSQAASDAGTMLAEFLAQRIAPGSRPLAKQKSGKKQHEAILKLFGQAERVGRELKLNMYKKARLANAFKWKLLDLGYEKEFVDEVTKDLLRHI